MTMLEQLATIIHAEDPDLKFAILEIGALRTEDQLEPFYSLLDLFPGSNIIGFETDQNLCEEMNRSAKDGVKY